MNTDKNVIDDLSWKDINKFIKEGGSKSAKRPFSKDVYAFIAKKDNYESVVGLALEGLQKTDPENANMEYAIKVANEMIEVAETVLKEEKAKEVLS